jgi:ATP-dependent Clp protease adaptor protein ClpS
MSNIEVAIEENIKVVYTEPKRWKVILLNDDATPMEFVVALLMDVFKHTPDSAEYVMLQVHQTGSGVAGIYSFEIAEAKAVDATNQARTNNYPLQIKLEEEE